MTKCRSLIVLAFKCQDSTLSYLDLVQRIGNHEREREMEEDGECEQDMLRE